MERGNRLVLFVSDRSYSSFTLKVYQNQSYIGNVFGLKGGEEKFSNSLLILI